MLEALLAVAALSLLALAGLGWIGVAYLGQAEARAQAAARALAARELDRVQALCATTLDELGRAPCAYPTPAGTWIDAPGYGVPGLRFRVDVQALDADPDAANANLALVTVTVRWDRPDTEADPPPWRFATYVHGRSDSYWEDWDEWSQGH